MSNRALPDFACFAVKGVLAHDSTIDIGQVQLDLARLLEDLHDHRRVRASGSGRWRRVH